MRNIIKDFPRAFSTSIDAVFSQHIDKPIQEGKDPQYLMRIRKALLALQDFQKMLSPQELYEVQQLAAKSDKISPVVKSAYTSALNQLGWLVMPPKALHNLSVFARSMISVVGIKNTDYNSFKPP